MGEYQNLGPHGNVASIRETFSCAQRTGDMSVNANDLLVLRFGGECRWAIPRTDCIASFTAPVGEVDDLEAAIAGALSSPLDFPAIDQAVVPGDSVALAVDPTLPALALVVGQICRWLCDHGSTQHNLKIVLASQSPLVSEPLREHLAANGLEHVEVELHDPDDPQTIAYVAANEDSDPIYMNRTLVDADVVIPVSCARHATSLDYLGSYGLFPLLSNRETLGQFHSLPRLENTQGHTKLKEWADQAAWWLGLLVSVQVVPADDGQVRAVFAGLIEPVEAACQAALRQAWQTDLAPADLVIALLDGGPAQQTWHEFARALKTATRFARPGGSIAVCTQLQESVGKNLGRLRDSHRSREEVAKKIAADKANDALPAAVVLEATTDYHVYLTSQLGRDTIEGLGLGAIENESQLTHLINQHASCTILTSAQHRFWG